MDASNWNILGSTLAAEESVTLNGVCYSQVDCFRRAIELYPAHAMAWNNLGAAMTVINQVVIIDGKRYTKLDCFRSAAKLDPDVRKTNSGCSCSIVYFFFFSFLGFDGLDRIFARSSSLVSFLSSS
jgi:hypothetical protein